MVDLLFADAELAELYDLLSPWTERGDSGFYLPLVMAAQNVLDVGCGTGLLLHRARDAGHTGRLCGLDPAEGMLRQARRRTDIDWIQGDLGSAGWDHEFDLVVMMGHAFQVFVEDEELSSALAAIHAALTDDGHFAFETRNPLVRAWEQWTTADPVLVVNAAGVTTRLERTVEMPVTGDRVSFSGTFSGPAFDPPRTSRSTLRFLDPDTLASFLAGAGLVIEEQFGDWDRGPLTAASPEIITIAGRARSTS